MDIKLLSESDRKIIELRERARVEEDYLMHNIICISCCQFFMQHRSWGLALASLDQVLEVPSDEDIPWIPDIESLLLRSRLRLITGDKKGL